MKNITLCLVADMYNVVNILVMETLQTQMVVSRLEGNSSIIPDVIPGEKKPLTPPTWFEEYDDEDFTMKKDKEMPKVWESDIE